jgi:hypothetical protein
VSVCTDVFIVMMLGVAAFCAGRIIVARRTRRPAELDSDAVHVLMGVAMAGMLASTLRFGASGVWIAVFAAGAAWFGWQALQVRDRATATAWLCPEPVPHLLECGAMLYMFLALPRVRPAGSAMSMGAPGSRLSVLPLLLALFMIGYVMRLADRVPLRVLAPAPASAAEARPAAAAACARVLAPRCAMLCKIAMGVTMAYMLVLML